MLWVNCALVRNGFVFYHANKSKASSRPLSPYIHPFLWLLQCVPSFTHCHWWCQHLFEVIQWWKRKVEGGVSIFLTEYCTDISIKQMNKAGSLDFCHTCTTGETTESLVSCMGGRYPMRLKLMASASVIMRLQRFRGERFTPAQLCTAGLLYTSLTDTLRKYNAF